jgi:hypothetical protein
MPNAYASTAGVTLLPACSQKYKIAAADIKSLQLHDAKRVRVHSTRDLAASLQPIPTTQVTAAAVEHRELWDRTSQPIAMRHRQQVPSVRLTR